MGKVTENRELIPQLNNIPSPCIGVCRIERMTCVGCGRTRAQIARWGIMDDAERMAVMSRLANCDENTEKPKHDASKHDA
jgi:uncharacterized protein